MVVVDQSHRQQNGKVKDDGGRHPHIDVIGVDETGEAIVAGQDTTVADPA